MEATSLLVHGGNCLRVAAMLLDSGVQNRRHSTALLIEMAT